MLYYRLTPAQSSPTHEQVVGERLKTLLRLAFEAKEGKNVATRLKCPLQLAFEAREGEKVATKD